MRFIILLGFICLTTINTFGQKDLKKANQFFKEKKYGLAIPHFKKALATKKNLSIKGKLAFCYKITNQIPAALELYEEIVSNDRAKMKYFYYYAETLMSSGRYEEAKSWFKEYAAIETDDETVDRMLASCDFAKTVQPYFGYATIEAFSQNSEEDDNAPVFWENGIVFTSDRKGKLKFLDTKSGATDRNYLRLYHSQLLPDGSFDKPKEYVSKINDARKNTGMVTFRPDGTAMYFTRNGNHLNRSNAYCLQLYELKSENGKAWGKAEQLSFCRKSANYMHPAISPDGKFLFFVSDKSGGLGGTDIYVSKKVKDRWSKPENLGAKINTDAHEGFPFMHQNGKLYFCSKGHLGLGGFDVFVTELDENGVWKTPTNLGAPINSPSDDISFFVDAYEEKGLFTSSRAGGDDDIFLISFIPKAVVINQEVTERIVETAPKEEEITTEVSKDSFETSVADIKEEKVEDITLNSKLEEQLPVEKIPEFQEEEPVVEGPIIVHPTNFLDFFELENIKFDQPIYSLPTIQFLDGEYFITFKIAKELDKVALILKKNPELSIEVAAHVANLEGYEEKMQLTQQRANSVEDYLQRKGITESRITAKGYGGQEPLNNCLMDIDCSIEEHDINIRIEIRVRF